MAGIHDTEAVNKGCTEKIKATNKAVRFLMPNNFNNLYSDNTVSI